MLRKRNISLLTGCFCNNCAQMYGFLTFTHVVDEAGGILGSLEERRVGGVFEVASVLLKGSFVESLLWEKKKETAFSDPCCETVFPI